MVRRARTLGMALLSLWMIAASAQAATLKIALPHRVRLGTPYTITIDGTFKRREVKGRAFLIAAIQVDAKPCQKTAQAENNVADQPQFLWRRTPLVGIYEAHSPFMQRNGPWKPTLAGPRHICAWLYPAFSGPTDDTPPIAIADVAYRVLARP